MTGHNSPGHYPPHTDQGPATDAGDAYHHPRPLRRGEVRIRAWVDCWEERHALDLYIQDGVPGSLVCLSHDPQSEIALAAMGADGGNLAPCVRAFLAYTRSQLDSKHLPAVFKIPVGVHGKTRQGRRDITRCLLTHYFLYSGRKNLLGRALRRSVIASGLLHTRGPICLHVGVGRPVTAADVQMPVVRLPGPHRYPCVYLDVPIRTLEEWWETVGSTAMAYVRNGIVLDAQWPGPGDPPLALVPGVGPDHLRIARAQVIPWPTIPALHGPAPGVAVVALEDDNDLL
jgi:hypothetical protein